MDEPGHPERSCASEGDGPARSVKGTSSLLSREQLFVLVSAAAVNLVSMMCYSILGPFFSKEAAKNGASSTVIACTNWSKIYVCSRDLCLRRSYNYLWGSFEIFSGLKLVLGPPLGGFLYQSCGYEVPFISLGCIVLLMVPLNIRILPDNESDPGEHSFWKLITLPKVTLMAFAVSSVSSCFGFLDIILSLFVLEKFNLLAGYVGLIFLGLALSYAISSPCFGLLSDKMPVSSKDRFVVFGHFITAGCYILLGPVAVLHIKSQLWILFLVLVINDISAGMSVIPTFPEVLNLLL
nr:MFS-type transporter SLC18B1 [Manis javanica]